MARDDNQHGLASSMTDLMTSLAVIFVLLLVASLNNRYRKEEAKKVEVVSMRDQILYELNQFEWDGTKIKVEVDKNDPLMLLILVPEQLLFDFNSREVIQAGREFLNDYMPFFSGNLCGERFSQHIDSVIIEGHTDPKGDEKDPTYNLKLSQDRSMNIVQAGYELLTDQKECFLRFVSASGRGSRDLVMDPLTGEVDNRKSRRVIIKIRLRSEQQQQMIDLLKADEQIEIMKGQ